MGWLVGGSSPSRSVNSGGVEYPTFTTALLPYPPRRNNQPVSIRARDREFDGRQPRGTSPSTSCNPAREMQPAAARRSWSSPAATEASPYAMPSPVQPASSNGAKEAVKNALSRWGRKVGEATRMAEDLSRNTWQHLRTAPSIGEAAVARIAQGTKVLAEGGHEKIFRRAFSAPPDEQLRKSYACYLSTAAGPVMGILYLSTARVAFCSDSPLSYEAGGGDRTTEWSYYKVAIPLHRLRAASASASELKPAEKFIQLVSADKHEFWFMGFVNYDGAVAHLQEALSGFHNLQAL